MGVRERLTVGQGHVRVGDAGQAPQGAAVGTREQLPVLGEGSLRGH